MNKLMTQKTTLPMEARNIRAIVVGNEIQISYYMDEEGSNGSNDTIAREEIKGTEEWLDKYFPIVKATTLSLEDCIFQHRPETKRQKDFKEKLIEIISSGLYDFRAQRMDPSFDEDGNICFKAGMMPAVGKSAIWWNQHAKEFLPEKESRLGMTEKERYAFCALLIKDLVEKMNYSISDAWKEICDQSKEIGHYWDSKGSKHDFEPTGSRKIVGWCDLGNTVKMTKNKEGGFSFVSGFYFNYGNNYPLADVSKCRYPSTRHFRGVGWITLSV